jgi:hypothetical protein
VAEEQKQTIFEPAKVIAVGIAAPLASLLTSRFGIAGTLLGLAISSVILTVLVDALKVYLARASTKVVKVPSGLRTGSYHRGIRGRLRALLSRVLSFPTRPLSPKKRRSIMRGSFIAAAISFLVGLMVITGVEASAGKSLSCWVWHNCPAESSTTTGDGSTSQTSTLPSILGGSQGAINNTTPQVSPSNPQQQPGGSNSPDTPQAPSQAPMIPDAGTPGVETPTASPSPQPGQRQGPSGARQDQQQNPPDPSGEDQQQSPPDYSDQDHQQSPSNNTGEGSSGKDQSNSSPASNQKPRWHEVLQVPWTT